MQIQPTLFYQNGDAKYFLVRHFDSFYTQNGETKLMN